jgi:hypothetical protein
VGDAQGRVRVLEVATGTWLAELSLPAAPERWQGTPHEGWSGVAGGRIQGLALIDGGARLIVATGDGDLTRHAIEARQTEASTVLPAPVAVLHVDEPGGRIAVGSDSGGVQELSLGDLSLGRTYRKEDATGAVGLVRYVQGGAGLLTALVDYAPSSEGPLGEVDDGGLTRWSTATGALEVRFGGPFGTVGAVQDDASSLVLAGVEAGLGVAYDVAGAVQGMGLNLRQALGLLRSSGQTFVVTADTRSVWLHGVPDLAPATRITDDTYGAALVPGSLSTSPEADVFAIGRSDGSVAVYRFDGGSGEIRSSARSDTIKGSDGVVVQVKRELVGHGAPLAEIAVAPGGSSLVTRDRSGRIVVWTPEAAATPAKSDHPGGLLGTPVGITAACPPGAPVLSFAEGGDWLVLVQPEGTVARVPLPSLEPIEIISVSAAGGPIDVLAAAHVAGVLVVSGRVGGLYVADATTGTVTKTLREPPPAPGEGELYPKLNPFSTLVPWPDGKHLLAAPWEHLASDGDTEPIALWRTADWSVAATSLQDHIGGRIVAAQEGSLLVLAERYEFGRLGVFSFDGAELNRLSWNPGYAPRWGIAAALGTIVVGSDPRGLMLVRVGAVPVVSFLPHSLGAITAIGAGSGSLWIGLAGGAVLELSVDDSGATPPPPPAECSSDANCGDDNPCTTDGCDSSTGKCSHVAIAECGSEPCAGKPCEDANPCTSDACDPTTGDCEHLPAAEGDPCGTADPCEPGACQGGTCVTAAKDCGDGNPCTVDGCSPLDGACTHDPADPGAPCTMQNGGAGTCTGGTCALPSGCDVSLTDPLGDVTGTTLPPSTAHLDLIGSAVAPAEGGWTITLEVPGQVPTSPMPGESQTSYGGFFMAANGTPSGLDVELVYVPGGSCKVWWWDAASSQFAHALITCIANGGTLTFHLPQSTFDLTKLDLAKWLSGISTTYQGSLVYDSAEIGCP